MEDMFISPKFISDVYRLSALVFRDFKWVVQK